MAKLINWGGSNQQGWLWTQWEIWRLFEAHEKWRGSMVGCLWRCMIMECFRLQIEDWRLKMGTLMMGACQHFFTCDDVVKQRTSIFRFLMSWGRCILMKRSERQVMVRYMIGQTLYYLTLKSIDLGNTQRRYLHPKQQRVSLPHLNIRDDLSIGCVVQISHRISIIAIIIPISRIATVTHPTSNPVPFQETSPNSNIWPPTQLPTSIALSPASLQNPWHLIHPPANPLWVSIRLFIWDLQPQANAKREWYPAAFQPTHHRLKTETSSKEKRREYNNEARRYQPT